MPAELRVKFYDIRSRLPPNHSFSSNCLRTRLVLNYLKVPYDTVWLSYPDIAPTMEGLGLPPSNPPPYDKKPRYTLPVIRHGERFVVGTLPIAMYLSIAFPPSAVRPALFPHNSLPTARLVANYITSIRTHALKVMLPTLPPMLDERGAEYFSRTRGEWLGVPLEKYHSDPDDKERIWTDVKNSMGLLVEILADNADGPFVLGKEASYSDLMMFATLFWIRCTQEKRWEELVLKPELRSLWDACQPYVA